MKLITLFIASSAVVSTYAEGTRCPTAGEIDSATGLYCPGQKEVDDFTSAIQAWWQVGNSDEMKGLWQEGDATVFCIFPPGCTKGTDNIANGLNGFHSLLSDFSYDHDKSWESGPGVLYYPMVHEFWKTPGNCTFDEYYRKVTYYDTDGKMTHSHVIVQPNQERADMLGKVMSKAVCDE